MRCHNCNQALAINIFTDIIFCPNCKRPNLTGYEERLRQQLEGPQCWIEDYPHVTAARAIFYANKIYNLANFQKEINFSKLESRIAEKGYSEAEVITQITVSGRKFEGLVDPGVGAVIVGLRQGDTGVVFVIFRGSVGMAVKEKNFGAGRDYRDHTQNVDWQVNFANTLYPVPWSPGAQAHKGFLQVYQSYSSKIKNNISLVLGEMFKIGIGPDRMQVVVTGHSQGAAHAILCAHDLACTDPDLNFVCLPFSSPRVGNLAFVQDFNLKVADHEVKYLLDGNQVEFKRCIVGVQQVDPVWWGQKKAFSMGLRKKDKKAANKVGIVGKGIFSHGRELDQYQIYYHVRWFHKISTLGFHVPGLLQKSVFKSLPQNSNN